MSAMREEIVSAILSSLPRGSRPSGVFVFTVEAFCQVLWVGAGIIGALAGQGIPSSIEGLEFALVALFVVLAIDSFQNNKDYSLPLSVCALGIFAAVLAPGAASHGGVDRLLPPAASPLPLPAPGRRAGAAKG